MGAGRPKGYADWAPKPHVLEIIEQVKLVLEEFDDLLPVTARQVFYRLVGRFGYEKTDRAWFRLCDYLTLARRAKMIPFSAMMDGRADTEWSQGWDGLDEVQQAVRETADKFTLDRLQGQEVFVELWCEAKGTMSQMNRIADDYSIPVYSASGFLTVSSTHDVGARAAVRWREDRRRTVLLHVGDFDPSGQSIFDTIEADSGAFARQYTGHEGVLVPKRVALTAEQVEQYEVETAPPKRSDSRTASWVGETAQLEALTPRQLAEIVREAVEEELDLDVLADVKADEARQRERLAEWLDDLS